MKSVPNNNNGGSDGGGLWSQTRLQEVFLGILVGLSMFFVFCRVQEVTPPDLNETLLESSPPIERRTATATDVTGTRSYLKQKRQPPPPKKRLYDPSWDVYQVIEAEQTGRIVGPRTEAPLPSRQCFFLDDSQLSHEDGNSGSWLVKTDHFLARMKPNNLEAIQTWEAAAQLTYEDEDTTPGGAKKFSKLRMTVDWLDFRCVYFVVFFLLRLLLGDLWNSH